MDTEDPMNDGLKIKGARDNDGKKKGKKKKEKMISLDEFVAKHGDFGGSPAPPSNNWAVMTENAEDDYESNFKFDRSQLPSAPKAALGPSVDLSLIPPNGPFSAYIGNLSYDAKEEDLYRLFSKLEVDTVRIITDGGRPRGYAYVDFLTKESLVEALSYNEREYMTRNIRVDLATDKNQEGGRTGGPGGGRSNEPDRTEGDWRRKEPSESGPPSNSFGSRDDLDRNSRFGGDRDRDRGYGFGSDRDRDRRGGGGGFGDRDRGFGDRDRGFGGDRDRDRGGRDRGFGDRDRGFGDRDRGFGDRDRGFGGDRDRGSGFGGDRDRDFGDRGGRYGSRGGGFDDNRSGRRDDFGRQNNGSDRGGPRSRDGSRDGGFDRDNRGGYGGDRDNRGGYGGDRDSRGGYGGDRDNRGGYGGDRDSRGGYGGDRDSRGGYGGERDYDRGGRYGSSRGGGYDRDDRGYGRRDDYGRQNRQDNGYDRRPRSRDGSLEHRSERGPKERPVLKLQPRSKPVEKEVKPPEPGGQRAASIFGSAKPVDTYAKEKEIEEKLKKKDVDRDEPKRRDDDTSRPRRYAEDGAVGRRSSEDNVTSENPKSPTSPKPAESQEAKLVPAPPPKENAWSKKREGAAPAAAPSASNPAPSRDASNNASSSSSQTTAGPRRDDRRDDRKIPAGRGGHPAKQGGEHHRDNKDRRPGGPRANGDGSASGDHQQLKKHQREKKLPKSIEEMPKFEEDRSRDFSTVNKFSYLMDNDDDGDGDGNDAKQGTRDAEVASSS